MCLGALPGEHSLKVARSARAVQRFPRSRVLTGSLSFMRGGASVPPDVAPKPLEPCLTALGLQWEPRDPVHTCVCRIWLGCKDPFLCLPKEPVPSKEMLEGEVGVKRGTPSDVANLANRPTSLLRQMSVRSWALRASYNWRWPRINRNVIDF